MNCQEAIERLPWWLNGSLEPAERREVDDHLAGCASCREALGETRLAWEVYAQHIPTEALVAYADDEQPPGIDPGLFERHLAECPQCAAELEMARASRLLSEHDEVPLLAPRPVAPVRQPRRERGWRAAALAAGLTGVIALGGLWTSIEKVHQLEDSLAAVPTLRGPAVKSERPTAVSTYHVSFEPVTRGLPEEAPTVPKSARYATLTFVPSSKDIYHEHTFKISDGAGGDVVGESPLRINIENFYSVDLSLDPLAPGNYLVQTYGIDKGAHLPLDSHPFRIIDK